MIPRTRPQNCINEYPGLLRDAATGLELTRKERSDEQTRDLLNSQRLAVLVAREHQVRQHVRRFLALASLFTCEVGPDDTKNRKLVVEMTHICMKINDIRGLQ